MKFYFDDIKKQKQLELILHSWLGTPYRHWAGVKGMGTDCIHFVARVLEEIGFGPFEIPEYSRDWHFHNDIELLFNGIKDRLTVQSVDLNKPLNGDIFLFKFGKTNSHSAIFYNEHLYQAVDKIGVLRLHWLDTKWHKRKQISFRIIK